MWFFKFTFNGDIETLSFQEYPYSPQSLHMWLFQLWPLWNAEPSNLQLLGFPTVCVHKCSFKCDPFKTSDTHTSHLCCIFLVSVSTWVIPNIWRILFHRCVSLCIFLNMNSLVNLQFVSAHVFLNVNLVEMLNHIIL